jgi:Universal stress protein family
MGDPLLVWRPLDGWLTLLVGLVVVGVAVFFSGWTVSHEAASGSPAFELLNRAGQWEPQLIGAGSRGHTALGRFVLGSVSQKVLTEARTSVRVARRATGAGASAERVVLGFDGSPGAKAAVRAVAARAHCSVEIIRAR